MNSEPQNTAPSAADDELDAEAVARYLSRHPNFFEGRDELLAGLTLPHESGRAISLLERQVTLLRERSEELNRYLGEFVDNAQVNDSLFEKTRLLVLELLKADSIERLAGIVEKEITALFGAADSRLLFIGGGMESGIAGTAAKAGGLSRRSYSEALEIFGALFEKKRTFCGEVDERQVAFLFPDSPRTIISAAVVPVHLPGETGDDDSPLVPVLVIGSEMPRHFNNSQDTLFVDFIGEVLSALILKLRRP